MAELQAVRGRDSVRHADRSTTRRYVVHSSRNDELVFGTTSGQAGLGWYIFEAKNQLNIPEVFAGLLIGLFIENVVFRVIEMKTVRRWGMQS